ncbi:endonuclease/exonuclease/phosphatase family protein [Bosea sp. (in: a-proteobacteria)]|jgi:endonuclease/exonuclease/phosphatase family metal-dependent hydrolase|uniref:endonuclease/exonuclease/phosphatase family protein n=1 Tax=Bosea sp. (in: a-proteobacteria) TaxID=1871050 RepID=UPI003F6E59DC
MSEALPALHLPDTPAAARDEIVALRAHLDSIVPPKRETSRNTLIATWNIRKFGDLSEIWLAGPKASPKRDWRALWAITEIVSRFDIVAIQEVVGNLKSLRTMIKTLGPNWSFLMTDVTAGDAGNGERMAYVFDTRRVSLSGLAGELVIPQEWLDETGKDALKRQFDRTPYAVSFRSGSDTVLLVTAHIKYGARGSDRIPELRGIARWMSGWADDTNEYGQNFMLLGDFNIDRHGDELWQAFVSTGLTVPEPLLGLPRTIFADPEKPLEQFYDQIAWFEKDRKRQLNLVFKSGGNIDFVPFAYLGEGFTRQQLSHRLSDHFPLWAEFETRKP